MSCCEGSCSCGKGNQTPAQENIHLVQLSTSQGMLSTFDWMKGLGNLTIDEEVVEVRFKNNRKAFFRNPHGLIIAKDDRVVVEVEGGHDVGTISLTGEHAKKQLQKKEAGLEKSSLRPAYRTANKADLETWLDARKHDRETLVKCRERAKYLQLDMRISDVEIRGDGKKVTIYYTTNGRIDLRELLKVCMNEFRMKIEFRQLLVQ